MKRPKHVVRFTQLTEGPSGSPYNPSVRMLYGIDEEGRVWRLYKNGAGDGWHLTGLAESGYKWEERNPSSAPLTALDMHIQQDAETRTDSIRS